MVVYQLSLLDSFIFFFFLLQKQEGSYDLQDIKIELSKLMNLSDCSLIIRQPNCKSRTSHRGKNIICMMKIYTGKALYGAAVSHTSSDRIEQRVKQS